MIDEERAHAYLLGVAFGYSVGAGTTLTRAVEELADSGAVRTLCNQTGVDEFEELARLTLTAVAHEGSVG